MDENGARLTWLPDEKGHVMTEDGTGPVRAVRADNFPLDVADAMEDGDHFAGIAAARQAAGADPGAWRGLITFALVHDVLCPSLRVKSVRISPESGRLSHSILSVLGEKTLCLLALEGGEKDLPLGLTDPGFLLIPPRNMPDMERAFDGQVPWYREGRFGDPTETMDPFLRQVLLERLEAFGEAGEAVEAFVRDLKGYEQRLEKDYLGSGKALYEKGMKCLIGLVGEKGFDDITSRRHAGACAEGSALLRAMDMPDPVKTIPERAEWYWKDTRVARESPRFFLEVGTDARARESLMELALDEEILEKCVRDYADELARRLRHLLDTAAGSEAVRGCVAGWAEELEHQSREQLSAITLRYPWRKQSPALMSLLTSALGERLAQAACDPFSDRLTLLSGGTFDDETMEGRCLLQWQGGSYLVLPPISRAMAAFEATATDTGYIPDSLTLEMDEAGRITAGFTIQGESGSIRVVRTYTSMEQLTLRADQVPCVALWPSVPLPQDKWQAYYVSCRGRITAEVFDGVWQTAASDDTAEGGLGTCSVLRSAVFPCCVLLSRNDLSLGAVMYHPQAYVPSALGEVVAAIDLGESGTAVAWRSADGIHDIAMPALWHAYLRGSRSDPAGESLPTFPMGSLMESAVVMTSPGGNDAFLSGYICPAAAVKGSGAACHFLWRDDEKGMRAGEILLRQTMLMACFDMVMHGADAVTWYASVPQNMNFDERRVLQERMRKAAEETARLTGLACKGAYCSWHNLRTAGSYIYQQLGRQPFLMLDIGGADSSLAVWLRGMPVPALETGIGDGLAMAMHTRFLDIPLTAARDLSLFPYIDSGALAGELARARESVADWEASRRTVDDLLGIHLAETMERFSRAVAGNFADYSQALLLLEMAKRMALCGLALEKVADVSTLTDKLPENLPIILSGRGAQVYAMLPESLQAALVRFAYLPLRSSHPVRHMRLQSSGAQKKETVYGLLMQETRDEARARMTEVGCTVPLDWLLGHFLMLLCGMFPQPFAMLFPGACRMDGMLSEGCAAMILQLASAWEGQDRVRAFDACLDRLRAWPDTGRAPAPGSASGQVPMMGSGAVPMAGSGPVPAAGNMPAAPQGNEPGLWMTGTGRPAR